MRTSLHCEDVSAGPHKGHINCLKADVKIRDALYGSFSADTIISNYLLLMEKVTDGITFIWFKKFLHTWGVICGENR